MHKRLQGMFLLVAITGLALPVLGQTSEVRTAGDKPAAHKSPPQHYTATLKTTTVKTLADGTTITTESVMVLAEDSQGRSMTSGTDLSIAKDGKPTIHYSVSDPVAGTFATWTSPGTQAVVITNHTQQSERTDCTIFFTTPEGFSTSAPDGDETAAPGKKVVGKFSSIMMRTDPKNSWLNSIPNDAKFEDLGITTIEGLEVHGTRVTQTTPAGAQGNDRPIVSTGEDWITTGENPRELNLRHISKDPSFGTSTTELDSISLEEPELSVFQPPEGYEIIKRDTHAAPCPKELQSPTQ